LSGLLAHSPPSFAIHLVNKLTLFAVTGTLYFPLELSPIVESRLMAALALSVDSLPTWEAMTARGVERTGGAAWIVVVGRTGDVELVTSLLDVTGTALATTGPGLDRTVVVCIVSVTAGCIPPFRLFVGVLVLAGVDPVAVEITNHDPKTTAPTTAGGIIARRRRPILAVPPCPTPRPDIRRRRPGAHRSIRTRRGLPMADHLHCLDTERMFPSMDRLSELESMRRSIAMLNPRTSALDREEAMALLGELQDVERKLLTLRRELRRLLDEG
jgi:hypothetical protein